jgi:hypothetical protein
MDAAASSRGFARLEEERGASKAPPQFVLPDEPGACSTSCFHTAMSPLLQTFELRDTVLLQTLKRPVLWLSLALSFVSVALRCSSEARHVEADEWHHNYFEAETAFIASTISMLHTSLVFFMTTYNSVGYARWMANWDSTQVGYGRINDLNVLVPAYMQATPKLAADVLRYVNAYHHLVYIGTIGHPEEYALHVCLQRRLLTEQEADMLRTAAGSKGMRCLIWASQSVTASGIDANLARQLNEMIVLLRRSMAYIWSFDDQMLPFAYTNCMNLFVLLVLAAKSCLSGFDYTASMLSEDGLAEPWKVAMVVGNNFGYAFAILALREVSHMMADPFSPSKNGINAERYLDLLVAGTSKLVADNATHAVDAKQDPGFVAMATADKECWEFKPRPTRDLEYLRTTRARALRLKKPPTAELARDLI